MPTASFAEFVLQNDIIGFFEQPLVLKSGRQSHFYVNWRQATNDAYLLDELTDHVAEFMVKQGWGEACVYGVPEGATKTGVITALKLARRSPRYQLGSHVVPMGRVKAKAHGRVEDRFYIGMPQGPTVLLEDTTTTGGSLIAAIEQLRRDGVSVVGALGLTDRMEKRDDGQTVQEAIHRLFGGEVRYVAMSDALSLLPMARQRRQPSAAVVSALEQEFAAYGVAPLRWEYA